MELSKEELIKEIKTLKKASEIHAKYSIAQYQKVLKLLEELEKDKKNLEQTIEENRRLTNKLKELVSFDPLTKLLNRRAFREELNKLKDKDFSVIFVDLDGFKQVNDIYGHKVGDELLKVVSKRIVNTLKEDDVVGRMGGDEFVILIKGKKTKEELEKIAEKLIKNVSKPIVIGKVKTKVGASVGIYIKKRGDSIDKALSFADIAMYEAKKSGKGKFVFFTFSLNKQKFQEKLKKALQEKKIKVFFKDVCNEEGVIAKKLLLNFENLSVKEIFNLIEDNESLLEEFIFYLIEHIDQKTMLNLHYKFFNEAFLKRIENSNICFIVDAKHIKYIKKEILEKFKNRGFKIVLDIKETDFPLSILKFPIDALQINKSFEDEKDEKIYEGVIKIAKDLGIKVVFDC